MQDLIKRVALDPTIKQRWKFISHKQGQVGDRVFLMRTGPNNPGLVASGHIHRRPYLADDFEDATKQAWYVDVQFDHLIPTPSSVLATKTHLVDHLKQDPRAFTPQASGVPYRGNESSLIALWKDLTDMRLGLIM